MALLLVAYSLSGCVQPEIKGIKANWGEVNNQYSELVVNVNINNPLPFLPLKDVESYIYINGIQIASGNAKEIEKDKVVLSIKIQNDKIKDMWVSHLQHGEKSEMLIKIVPVINLLIMDYRYPIEVKKEFVTHIFGVSLPNQGITIAGKKVFSLENIKLDLGKVNNLKTELIVNGRVVNNAPVNIDVKRIEYQIAMNGIVVGKGTQRLDINLKSGTQENIKIPLFIDNTKLPEWWVTHIKNGEHSTVKIDANLYVEFMGTEYPIRLSQETELNTALAGSVGI